MSGFPPEVADLDGFLSLAFFAETPFTVDYARGVSMSALPVRVRRSMSGSKATGRP